MVVDAVARMGEYDTAVLMSGDSDFVSLVNLLRGKNKKVVVVSNGKTLTKTFTIK